jgi:hypothetical protein
MVTKWCAAAPPEMFDWRSTLTCPARSTLLPMMIRSASSQSCATWQQAISRQSLPTRVQPPPLTVPRLIVTNSRIVLRSPISSWVGSFLYERSWGGPPRLACPTTRLSWPRRVAPSSTTCGPIRVRSPITTMLPTTL